MEYGSEFEVPSQRSNRQAEFLRAPCDQMKIITPIQNQPKIIALLLMTIVTFMHYDVIKKIRNRAGVGITNGDAYLEECKTDKIKMRDLIRNERRLELCFESFRFWDLRRWKLNLNETTRGLDVNGNIYTLFDVEKRAYTDYMYYGPLPNSQILKFSNLSQNKGLN